MNTMQNCLQDVQCKNLDEDVCLQEKELPSPSLTSFMHDNIILLNLKTLDVNDSMKMIVKNELDIKSEVEDVYIGSSTAPLLTVVDDMKNRMDIENEILVKECMPDEISVKNEEVFATTYQNESIPECALISDASSESENKQKVADSGAKTISMKIQETLREKYRNLNKTQSKKVLRRRSHLNNSSTKPKLQLNYKQNISKESKSLHFSKNTLNSPDKSASKCVVSCRFCKNSFKTIEDCHNHSCNKSKSESNQVMHECKSCFMVFKFKNHLDRHVKGHTRNNCTVCNAQLTTRKALCKHLKVVHNINEPQKLYKCNFCSKTFSKRTSLIVHFKNHADGKFLCLKCGFMCTSEEEYIDHFKEHMKDLKFECALCNVKFVRRQQYDQHMMGHERHSCSICDVTFSTKKLFIKHQQSIHGVSKDSNNRRHECPICKKSFVRPMHLKIHLRSHTGEKPVKCSYCEKNFTNNQALGKHMKSATHLQNVRDGQDFKLDKSFLCSICGATFYRHHSLVRHVELSHTSGEPFKCLYCDYSTKCKANMKRHTEGHSDIKRYVCEICGASFRALATLKEHHAFVHSERRSFACDTCSKSFKNKSSLQRHLRIHKEDRPYKCHCNRDYKRLSHLKRHVLSAHHMTVKRSFDNKQIEICDIGMDSATNNNLTAADKTPEIEQDSILCNSLINSQDKNFNNIYENCLNKNLIDDPFSLGTSDEENEYKYVPCQNMPNFLDKSDLDITSEAITKSPLMSIISHSVEQSDSQDSVSLDDPNLNLSPDNYLTFSLSASPLSVMGMESASTNLQGISSAQDSLNRPRSLPNLNFETSNVDTFLPFLMRNSDLSASITPAYLLNINSELPSPPIEQNCSSKQLFGESGDILSLQTFTSNAESGITDCSAENFFASRNTDIWDSTRDRNRLSFVDVDLTDDSCGKVTSSIPDFQSNLSLNSSPLLACDLVFPNDPLMECAIDTASFNTEEFILT